MRPKWTRRGLWALAAVSIYLSYWVSIDPFVVETRPGRVKTRVVRLEPLGPYEQVFDITHPMTADEAIKQWVVAKPDELKELKKEIPKYVELKTLKPGMRVIVQYAQGPVSLLTGVRFELAIEKWVDVTRVIPKRDTLVKWAVHLSGQDSPGAWIARRATTGTTLAYRAPATLFASEHTELKVDIRIMTYSALVKTTMWDSAREAKLDPQLVADLAEIFAWQVDFAREVRKGDSWRMSVEEKWMDGRRLGWGKIIAAEFESQGDTYTALLFRRNGKEMGYFTPEGSSLRRLFLKSPIVYGRITSRFTQDRLHPILKRHRPHLGVDYAAVPGTPVRSVGDGEVIEAKDTADGGKVLKVRHTTFYSSAYKHLRGFAPNLIVGSRVRQGQLVGYVGNTGLSTGSHLHLSSQGGIADRWVKKFPSVDRYDLQKPRWSFVSLALRTLPPSMKPMPNPVELAKAEPKDADPAKADGKKPEPLKASRQLAAVNPQNQKKNRKAPESQVR